MKFVTYFLAESIDKKVKLSFEHLNFAWLELGDAMENLKKHNKTNQEVLKKADAFLNEISKKRI
jgi:hypothetical protein